MVGLHVFPPQRVIFDSQFKTESSVPLGHRRWGQALPQFRFVGLVDKRIEGILIEIFLGSQERHMWFLNSAGNEKRLVTVAFLLQPGDDLANILAVLVLGIG